MTILTTVNISFPGFRKPRKERRANAFPIKITLAVPAGALRDGSKRKDIQLFDIVQKNFHVDRALLWYKVLTTFTPFPVLPII